MKVKYSIIVLLAVCSLFAAEIKVACIGDSITAGVGAKNRKANSFPALLQSKLGDKYQVMNYGVSGIKMTNYKGHKNWKKALEFHPNIVVIKLGTNDTKDRKSKDKEAFVSAYKTAYEEMLTALKNLPSKPTIYLCTPVPVFKDRWGINEKTTIEDVIPAINEIATQHKLQIIDLYKAMTGKGAMVPDGVHPNDEGYKVMAELIHKSIKQ